MGEVEVYIKRYHMKSGEMALEKAVHSATPTKAAPAPVPNLAKVRTSTEINITDLQWNEVTNTFTGDWNALRSMSFDYPSTVIVYNDQTQREVRFMQRVPGSGCYTSNDLGYTIYLTLI